jgi:hypothetical protein
MYSVEFVIHDVGIRQGTLEVRIDGEEEINGIRYYRQVALLSGPVPSNSVISFWRVGKSGVFRISGKHKDEPEVLDMPFPFKVGDTWTTHQEKEIGRYRIEGYQTLELLRKEYSDCLKISFHSESQEETIDGVFFYAKDVGVVRQIVKTKLVTMDIVLKKYEK